MATHHLDTAKNTAVNYFSRDLDPVLTIAPGDTVVVHTLDSGGHVGRPGADGQLPPRFFAEQRGHCLVGPIAVDGAKPGQSLAVHFDDLVPDDWGFTAAGLRETPLNNRLGMKPDDGARLIWEIDLDKRIASNQLGLATAIAPFLGVVAVAPPEPGHHSTVPPRPIGAGNIDCRDLVAGATLYIPVAVDGALLSVGDGHAAQGDGEVSGTAIECGMTTTMTIDLIDEPALPSVYATAPEGRITFGFDADLNEATAVALDAMLDWMAASYGISRAEALAVASATVSMRVTQIANQTWGVHALLPAGAVLEG
ncbi:acetamidase/formamidase family protein [Microlunatus sp. Gsoil 973]|uniref:acetamidase/formamidase family protein n=1 Tax=Microlunatus sp. Gsoil 973 TaxID=2672569 RepID=UPI0012B46753|nr:acetamidase/formamidase family protein [Microlunatus sp. Gsoil 973]QGN34263.1 acetamidase [Microlunatus sp. Gsoil 973]